MEGIIKKTLASILIAIMMINSSMLLIVSEAIEKVEETTNNKNVQFSVYFKDASGNIVAETAEKINSENIRLYAQISVKQEGYLENASIELKDSNFTFDTDGTTEGISAKEENKVTVDYIGAGETKEVELKIKTNKQTEYSLEDLNKATTIEFNGNYVNSKNNNAIKTTRKVQWNQTSPYDQANNGIKLEQEIITNKVVNYEGKEKRILQVLVNNGLDGNEYPVKETTIEMNTPKVENANPEKVIINTTSKNLTTTEEITADNYEYNKETGKITIKTENKENENNKIEWNQTGEDNYIVTYIYASTEKVGQQEIEAQAKIKLYDEKETTLTSESKIQTNNEEKDGTITISIENKENEIYKGKLYENGEREITENVKINVNSIKTSEKIEIEETTQDLSTNKITINKNNIMEILGQEGRLQIINVENGQILEEINKDTQTTENGNIEIKTNNVQRLKIQTTEPQKVGIINLEIEKVLKENNAKIIKNKQAVNYEVTGKYTKGNEQQQINTATTTVQLKETTTTAKLEINKEALNTVQENEIQAKVTLNEDTEANDLYKNPQIEIELPEQIETAEITNINKMYADNFDITTSKIEEKNGRKIIKIGLTGEDKTYVENIIGGPTIIVDLKVSLNKTAKTETKQITMTYTNEKAQGYENGEKQGIATKTIEITSPTGIITTNKIEELNVSTVGEEDNKNVKIEVGKEEKQTTIKKEVINNTGAKVENVVVTGRLATNGKENNMGITMTKEINVEGIEGAKVYYTEKEEATTDLADSNNEWKEEIEDNSNVKNYMVVIDKMEATDTANIEYAEAIPESLEYNKNAIETYNVDYVETETNTKQTTNGTTVEMTTGTGPDVNVTLTAEVGGEELQNNSEVKQGEVIKYIAKVTNNGTNSATNITVNTKVPDGTVLVKAQDSYDTKNEYYTEYTNTKDISSKIEELAASETKELSFEVRVKNDTAKGTTIKNKVTSEYDGITKESNEVSNIVANGEIRVSTMSRMDDSVNITQNDIVKYSIIIENTSNRAKKDLKVSFQYPETLELIRQEADKTTENIEKIDANTVNVKSIGANQTVIVDLYFNVKTITKPEDTKVEFYAKVIDGNTTYRTNKFIKTANLSEYLTLNLTSKNQDDYVKSGDQIEYNVQVLGNNIENSQTVTLSTQLPSEVTLKEIYVNNEKITSYKQTGSILTFEVSCNSTKNTEVKIIVVVNEIENLTADREIKNKIYGYLSSKTYESNEVKHIIEKNKNNNNDNNNGNDNNNNNGGNNNNSNNNGNNSNNNNNNNNNNGNSNNTTTYEIKGKAFIDDNSDGKIDSTESGKENIKVRLINSNNNELVKYNGKEIETTTNSNGEYTLSNVPNGNYIVVFDYDNTLYQLTTYKKQGVQENENSDVFNKKINIDGTEKEYAVTDIINVNNKSVANVNIGLVTLKEMNLKLEKSINKVTVQNSSETTTYNYSSVDLAKVEIHAKKLVGTTIIVEYQIKVTNTGKVDAYVRNIKDSMPKDMTFKSELNTQWYQKDGDLYTTSLTNTKIQPGETKTVSLVLMKQMNNSNIGLVNNNAEIAEIYNQQDLKETNTNDNKDNAQLIVSIKTGAFIAYSVIFVGIFIAIIIAGVIIINKRNGILGGR